jgi:hypothetical protein
MLALAACPARSFRWVAGIFKLSKGTEMNKLLAALIAAAFATSGFAASHAKEMKKDEAKPAAAAASGAASAPAMKKDEAKPAAKAEEKKTEMKKEEPKK